MPTQKGLPEVVEGDTQVPLSDHPLEVVILVLEAVSFYMESVNNEINTGIH